MTSDCPHVDDVIDDPTCWPMGCLVPLVLLHMLANGVSSSRGALSIASEPEDVDDVMTASKFR